MALKQSSEFKPEFESATEGQAATATESNTQSNTEAEIADAGVQASTAIAVAATTAVGAAVTGNKVDHVKPAFHGLKDRFNTEQVDSLSLSVPRITFEQGEMLKAKDALGKEIVLVIESWNLRWVLGSGEDNKESKDFFRISYDGRHIYATQKDGGTECKAYLDALKADGHDKANMSKYGDIWGFIAEVDGKPIPEEQWEMVCVQASQTSLGNFEGFAVSRGLLAARGIGKVSDRVRIKATPRTNGDGKKYTNAQFLPA